MFIELYRAQENNSLTKGKLLEAWITDLASSLYAYMVMLDTSGRDAEARIYKDLRTRIFACRDNYRKDAIDPQVMSDVSLELGCHYRWLQIMKPAEATILQTAANDSINLAYILKAEHANIVEASLKQAEPQA